MGRFEEKTTRKGELVRPQNWGKLMEFLLCEKNSTGFDSQFRLIGVRRAGSTEQYPRT